MPQQYYVVISDDTIQIFHNRPDANKYRRCIHNTLDAQSELYHIDRNPTSLTIQEIHKLGKEVKH